MRDSVSLLQDYEFERTLVTHGSNVLESGRDAIDTLIEDLETAEDYPTA